MTPRPDGRGRTARWLSKSRRASLRLATKTYEVVTRHRIAGMAGEASFFTLLALPPLLFGLVGTLGYLARTIGEGTVLAVRTTLERSAATVLTPDAIDSLLQPVLDEVLNTGRAGIISVGFVLVLWSGSAAINVFVDTVTVVYGMAGQRNAVRQRLLSLALYTVALLSGIVLLPVLAVGPVWLAQLLPPAAAGIHALYWPVVAVTSIALLTTLYTSAIPVRTPWREHLPGAALALLLWLAGSLLLRLYLSVSLDRSPVYGTLAAPMGVLLWLYITSFAVLLGAAMNAELDTIMPSRRTAELRRQLDQQ